MTALVAVGKERRSQSAATMPRVHVLKADAARMPVRYALYTLSQPRKPLTA
jgi:hypothetical protein